MTTTIKWAMRQHPDKSWTGELYVPLEQMFGPARGQMKYAKFSSAQPGSPLAPKSKAEALQQASSLASKILGNPLLQAALPPGAGVAVSAINYLADSAVAGDLASAAKNVVGKGAKRLAKALKFW